MRPPKLCASLALILALMAVPALAQQQERDQHHPGETPPAAGMRGPGMQGGAMAGGMPMGMMRMMGQDGMAGMAAMMAEHVEGRLAFLKTELKITDAQLPLWNAVAEAIRANAKSMSEMMSGVMTGSSQTTATLPEKLALREKMMTSHLEALRRLKAAVDPLYAALSPEQKKSADELLMGPMGMGMMM
jgi:hypothetical protein